MPKRILIVESDSALSRVLCDNFSFDGFEVLEVRARDDAMQAVRTFAPDLVVVDVTASGVDAATLMTSLRQEHSTPVLMLSTRGRGPALPPPDGGGEGAVVAGVSELLPKPFGLDELLERARMLLDLPGSTI